MKISPKLAYDHPSQKEKKTNSEEAIRAFQQQLEELAKRLRIDWIKARGGMVREERCDTAEDLERVIDSTAIPHSEENDQELEENTQVLYQTIITAHQEFFLKALNQSVAQVIENRYQGFVQSTRRGKLKGAEKARNYWLALKGFFIENHSFSEIASLIRERDQTAVTRLLDLSNMLQDVRRLTLHGMLIEIQQVLKTFKLQTTEDLKRGCAQIDAWMAELANDRDDPNNPPLKGSEIAKPIDELLEEEKKRRMSGRAYKQPNRFTEAVCRYLKTTVR